MKQLFTYGLVTAAALATVAAVPELAPEKVRGVDFVKENNIKAPAATEAVKKEVRCVGKTSAIVVRNGLKRLQAPGLDSGKIRKPSRRAAEGSETGSATVFFESFEGWDGEDPEWTPEGWTLKQKEGVERAESWTPALPNPYLPGPSDGDYYYAINFSSNEVDEWLITPEIETVESMVLSFDAYIDPMFLFSLDNVNWDTMEFIGDKIVAATLQIWAQAEGGEWTMLHDFVDDYKDMSGTELAMLSPMSLEKKTVSLGEFAGKKIKLAFRYVGVDGNTMFIDAVSVGYPSLEGVSFMSPFETLYWGFDRNPDLGGVGLDIAQLPVLAPVTWTNTSYIDLEDVEYTWNYYDPETFESATSADPDELSLTYKPDYTSPTTMRNNFHVAPQLTATAPNATPGTYQTAYQMLAAGGKGEMSFRDGTEIEVSLMPFGWHAAGLEMITVDDPEIGDGSIPVFGHNANTDRYWLNYSLPDVTPNPSDYSHLLSVANLFMPSATAPIIVNGVTAYGWGSVSDDAEFTATIYALNADMSNQIEDFTTVASATIKGSDFLREYEDGDKGYLVLPFDFEAPVELLSTEEHPAYFIMIEGFRSDKVEYFTLLTSGKDDPDYLCYGYLHFEIDIESQSGRPVYHNIKPLVYKANGDFVDPYRSFAIGLNAEYPWLTCDSKGVELLPGETSTEVALGSYYDGSKLTVEAPEGITATATGRYNECKLTVTHSDQSVAVDGEIVVKGPGVEVTIPVKAAESAIAEIIGDGATITGIYDLTGRRVSRDEAVNGIYVVKYSDGSVRKALVK